MAKKKAVETTTKDKVLFGFSIAGGFLLLVSCVPAVPWRYGYQNGYFGARFPAARTYSLTHLGNQHGQSQSWMTLKRQICLKMTEYQNPNPVAMGAGLLGTATGAGASLAGCAGWDNCKSHVSARCNAYTSIAMVGVVCLLLNLIAAVAAFSTPVLLGQEEGAGGKKKKEKLEKAAKTKTMYSSITAFASSFLSVVAWYFLTESSFHGLRSTAYYPWPQAYLGVGIAGFGVFLLFCSMYSGVTRLHPIGGGGSGKDDAEDYDEDAAKNPLLPGQGALPQH